MKRKTLVTLSIAATLTIGGLQTTGSTASAHSSVSDLKNKQEDVKSKKDDVNQEIDKKESEISDNINRQESIKKEIAELDNKTRDTEDRIKEKTAEIEKTNAEIEKLKAEIEELKKKIAERNELLKERARSMQEKGGSASYMDVLLGAESFGDFINRITAVNAIVSADKKIIDEQKADQASLEKKQAEVEDKLAELEDAKANLVSLKKDLESQKGQKQELFKELEKEQSQLKVEKTELVAHASELEEMEKEIGGQIQAEQARLAELARQKEIERQKELEAQRKAEAERLAAQQAAQQAAQKNSGSSNTAVSTPDPVQSKPVSEGRWTRPSAGYITTEFGHDMLNGKPRFHYGTDIAAGGNVPIVAAADGYVIKSHYSSSYGNVVYITHSINGKTFTTVYAHMSGAGVSSGQFVEKGQRIGTMGNTGYSFGQHLHFELHAGEWNNSKSNAVNPRQYINM
ncbi:peptidoglycan DD-metalloendopeptidase family protein [Rossellomorea vietnamensis]|uniref:Peptidoglycan DD-metalloendopeptidase family protein n=1 Tax=Rossellomorea vietnamensis TaxID=218284 RepID=A0A5D4MA90_9BACI|nr:MULTISPECIES: peptidoglycan DD-metalloendopeptidase family protein [Bacillaceae]TYR98874.1 peptidoglycan DD-metalloendopeptidase family protein [Rossellomorea vietnamensis]